MGLFGKKKLSEKEAARIFVLSILDNMQDGWRTFHSALQEILGQQIEIDSPKIASEFMVCMTVIHLQSLLSLFPREQANRLRQYVVDGLCFNEHGISLTEIIAKYQQAWDLKSGGNNPFAPMSAVLLTFLERIGYAKRVSAGDEEFVHPGVLMALGHIFMKSVKPTWKDIASDYRVVS